MHLLINTGSTQLTELDREECATQSAERKKKKKKKLEKRGQKKKIIIKPAIKFDQLERSAL